MGNCGGSVIGTWLGPAATVKKGFKVCVCGGAGQIGHAISLLMALHPRVSELALFDLTITRYPIEGISADLSSIDRECQVKAYALQPAQRPIDHLEECLTGCHLVLIPTGVPSKGKTKSNVLRINAKIAQSIVEACASFCPNAILGLLVNPLASIVPAMAELYVKKGLDPMKVCGITTVDVIRANKFVYEETKKPLGTICVPVIGGYSGGGGSETVVPLFSQDKAAAKIPLERRKELVARVRGVREDGGDAVGEVKKASSSFQSSAYACARFGSAVLSGLAGDKTIETAFVQSSIVAKYAPGNELPYCSSRVTFGPKGIEKVHPLGQLRDYEEDYMRDAAALLLEEVIEGLRYAQDNDLYDEAASRSPRLSAE